jgi:hypothetical protein
VKITGCWNGLAKRLDRASATDADLQGDTPCAAPWPSPAPSRTRKALSKNSRQIIEAYRSAHPDEENARLQARPRGRHLQRPPPQCTARLAQGRAPDNTCRILSNARCLSEGVDVPALDAVLFLNPRNSVIDVVQSVGRVMRRAEGKKYGYIILPIGIPADSARGSPQGQREIQSRLAGAPGPPRPRRPLQRHRQPDRTEQKRPDAIQVIGVGGGRPRKRRQAGDGDSLPKGPRSAGRVRLPAARGMERRHLRPHRPEVRRPPYWESWAKDVAVIAERTPRRIKALLDPGRSATKPPSPISWPVCGRT